MENLKRVRLAKEMEDPYYLKEPKLIELYNKSLPPKEAYYHFPPPDEIIIINQKKPKKSFRRVYYNVPYTDFENNMISQFKELISKHPETQLPDYFGDYLLLAFIYATSCDLAKSYKQLTKYLDFCKKTFPLILTPQSKVREILNRGFVYVYGRDNRFRPIVICECKIFQKHYKEYATEEILQSVYFLCQYIVNNMLIPGQFESWTFIINLTGVSVLSLPEPVKKMIPALSDYFLARLYKNYIMGLNFITRLLYKIACNFLDPVTVSKVNILDKIGDKKMFEIIRRDNIEQKFGGTAPNLPVDEVDGFFPPRMPSEHFIKDEENVNNILISEEEYIEKYKNGKIPDCSVSPYIYEKLNSSKTENIQNSEQENEQEIINIDEVKNENIEQNKPNPIIEDNKNKIIEEEKMKKLNSIQIKKSIEQEKFNKFINYNWNFIEELSLPIYNSINCKKLNDIKIDINKFGIKKKKFFSNISSFH